MKKIPALLRLRLLLLVKKKKHHRWKVLLSVLPSPDRPTDRPAKFIADSGYIITVIYGGGGGASCSHREPFPLASRVRGRRDPYPIAPRPTPTRRILIGKSGNGRVTDIDIPTDKAYGAPVHRPTDRPGLARTPNHPPPITAAECQSGPFHPPSVRPSFLPGDSMKPKAHGMLPNRTRRLVEPWRGWVSSLLRTTTTSPPPPLHCPVCMLRYIEWPPSLCMFSLF